MDSRSIATFAATGEVLDVGWDLLSMLPKEELNCIDEDFIEEYYEEEQEAEEVAAD